VRESIVLHLLFLCSLGNHKIGDAGAIALAEALTETNNVTFQVSDLCQCFHHDSSLADNNIGPVGARALAEALLINRSVTHL
jgi:hypothetical protein